MSNPAVISGLNAGKKVENIYATLTDKEGLPLFTFLFNPEAKRFSRSANYTEAPTALTSTPSQQYKYTTGLTLQLSNLLMQSYAEGKTCKLLLQRLQGLMVADPTNSKLTPSLVYFTWGSDKFGPAVITSLDWTESAWLNGEVAAARVNFTLLEVPSIKLESTPTAKDLEKASTKTATLTPRQVSESANEATKWLKSNVKKLPEKTAALVKTNNYKLSTDSQGNVTIFSNKNENLGVVGNYKNGKFTTTNNSLTTTSILVNALI
ncbi:CIS tube protein [Nostoc sp.]|uniref:CIS tube protein n=1 Tax=Nostoc sp. TaxID=1180 RepID=UPI002FF541FD